MLRQRVLTAAVAAPLALAAAAVGGWVQAALAALAALLAGRELVDLLVRQGAVAPGFLAPAAAVLPVLFATAWPSPQLAALGAVLALLLTATAWVMAAARARLPGRALDWASHAALAAAWIGWPLGTWLWLRTSSGWGAAAYPLLVIWAADAAAYFVGLRWGRRPLAPSLSPRKSVEGAVAGLAAAALAGWLLRGLIGLEGWAAWVAGAVLAVLGLCGDLWESAFKRAAGVKDTGALLPGHGGMLDRLDSLLLAIPATAAMVVAVRKGG